MDLCITLGGDGTVLHLASLFVADEPLPPVVSFAMGTLGFLTPFDVTDFADTLNRVRRQGFRRARGIAGDEPSEITGS